MRFGLTGGIGSGKSEVAKMFRDLGAFTIDYDELNKAVELQNPSLVEKIANIFNASPRDDGTLDPAEIAAIVFNDSAKLKQLEKLKHPYIIDLAMQIEDSKRLEYDVFVHEVPLLIEANLMRYFDKIIVLIADEDLRIQRVAAQRGLSPAQIKARIDAQMRDRDRIKFADFTINTNASLEDVRAQVEAIQP